MQWCERSQVNGQNIVNEWNKCQLITGQSFLWLFNTVDTVRVCPWPEAGIFSYLELQAVLLAKGPNRRY